MNRDEILARSREDNKQADPYERETMQLISKWQSAVLLLLAVILNFVHTRLTGRSDTGLFAVFIGFNAVSAVIHALREKSWLWRGLAVFFTVMTVVLIVTYISDLQG